jgi:hypothetical protein
LKGEIVVNAENYHAVVIGCGRGGENIGAHSIGYVHGKAYRDNPRIELAGACDLDPANLDRFCEHFSVPYKTGNSEELLREVRPESVSICTYVGSRPELVEASVRNGAKAIWCEKPFSLTIQEGRRLVELCEENGVKLVINHYRRYLDRLRRCDCRSFPSVPIGDVAAGRLSQSGPFRQNLSSACRPGPLGISAESLTFSAILELRSKCVALKDQCYPLSYSDAHGAE